MRFTSLVQAGRQLDSELDVPLRVKGLRVAAALPLA
jgi:hypothetical protein